MACSDNNGGWGDMEWFLLEEEAVEEEAREAREALELAPWWDNLDELPEQISAFDMPEPQYDTPAYTERDRFLDMLRTVLWTLEIERYHDDIPF